MSDKKIGMSVFVGQDFDCEFHTTTFGWATVGYLSKIKKKSDPVFGEFRYIQKSSTLGYPLCRPRLNHWHFNDGSMVLPDGLVVEAKTRDCRSYSGHNTGGIGGLELKYIFGGGDIIAVKIIGAHPDYSEDAKRLGIPVVEAP